jgi:hypothetical protein
MKRAQLPNYALALAVLIVGLVAVGVPLSMMLPIMIVLACPLMMILMMSGMHGDDRRSQHDHPSAMPKDHGQPPVVGPR